MLALSGCSSSSSSTTHITTGGSLVQMSSDPYSIAPGQHATEVEPHMLANGTTLVAAFQVGRIAPGGATNIGWATSTDSGTTWAHGFLPGLTTGEGSGPYDAVSDPAVAYDAKHNVWMIASLPISKTSATPAVAVSRSTDGGLTWQNPASVDTTSESSDKNWIVCDSAAASPHYGNCYVEWDDPANAAFPNILLMSTSTDGGVTWSAPVATANNAMGIGGQPLVQPNGNVVVPVIATVGPNLVMASFVSADGGATWSAPVEISNVQIHLDAGGIRAGSLPSAAVDGAGTVWTVWEDCRFRTNCSTNDLVYSTSTDGVTWTTVARVPIDDTTSTVDHMIPGIGIDPATSGSTAHVGIHYYTYSQSNCTLATCQLSVGFISSGNGGTTWNTPVTLAGPMQLGWLPQSQNGLMVGDYIATAFVNGVPRGVFAVASASSGTAFSEAMYTASGLTAAVAGKQLSAKADRPLHKMSDKVEREVPEKGVRPPGRKMARRAK